MKLAILASGIVAAAGGYLVSQARATSPAPDEHANHSEHATAGSVVVQQSSAIPASGQTAQARIAASPRHGEWVTIKVGSDSVKAWVVFPERAQKAPVVIAIHENTGLNVWTRSVADQLAADGFIGIAPDLTTPFKTGDLTAETPGDVGRAAIQRVTPEFANAAIDAVAKYGMSLPAALPKYGIIGFCWGGARSFSHATHAPSLGASVVYYGSPPTPEAMANIKAPVLGLYGGADARINATIPSADSAMKRHGKSYEYVIYDGAGHGFLRGQENSEANAKAAQEAWPKMLAFLKAKLGS